MFEAICGLVVMVLLIGKCISVSNEVHRYMKENNQFEPWHAKTIL